MSIEPIKHPDGTQIPDTPVQQARRAASTSDVISSQSATGVDTTIQNTAGSGQNLPTLPPSASTDSPSVQLASAAATFSAVEVQIQAVAGQLEKAADDFQQMLTSMNFNQLVSVINQTTTINSLKSKIAQDQSTITKLTAQNAVATPALQAAQENLAQLNSQLSYAVVCCLSDTSQSPSGQSSNGYPIMNSSVNPPIPNMIPGSNPPKPYVVSVMDTVPNSNPPISYTMWVVNNPTTPVYYVPGSSPPTPIVNQYGFVTSLNDPSLKPPGPYTQLPNKAKLIDTSTWSLDSSLGNSPGFGGQNFLQANCPNAYYLTALLSRIGQTTQTQTMPSREISTNPPISLLMESPASGIDYFIKTSTNTSYTWNTLNSDITDSSTGQPWLTEMGLGNPSLTTGYQGNFKAVQNNTTILAANNRMINSLTNNLPNEELSCEQNEQALLETFGLPADSDQLAGILAAVNKARKNLQALIDAYNDKHQGNALAVFTAISSDIGENMSNIEQAVGNQNFQLTQFNLAQTEVMQSINNQMATTLLALKTAQQELAQVQKAAQALQDTAMALTAALMAVAIAQAITSAIPGAAVITMIITAVLGALMGAITVAQGVTQYYMGMDMEKVAAQQKILAQEKYTYSSAQAESTLAQNMASAMTQSLRTIIKDVQKMLKQASDSIGSYSAAIASHQQS